ncbi:MAG: hypothetical protein PHH98_04175 [Candidatus Gracilibacteria bacterium]|nr:hypothetical protein [Candidatus Gracilibacteria bacterium]
MIAGGDYYTLLENIETSSGQIDTFVSTRTNLQVDFDDNKIGKYNLSIDDFYNNATGSIYINNIDIKKEVQQYSINWQNVVNNTNDAVIYQIDSDNDGNYDKTTQLPPTFQDNIVPTTSINFVGISTTGEANSFIESVSIQLDAQDNERGSGIDNTYYSLDNNSGSLIYLPYTKTIEINGLGEYTLNYYSIDIFGNNRDGTNSNIYTYRKTRNI